MLIHPILTIFVFYFLHQCLQAVAEIPFSPDHIERLAARAVFVERDYEINHHDLLRHLEEHHLARIRLIHDEHLDVPIPGSKTETVGYHLTGYFVDDFTYHTAIIEMAASGVLPRKSDTKDLIVKRVRIPNPGNPDMTGKGRGGKSPNNQRSICERHPFLQNWFAALSAWPICDGSFWATREWRGSRIWRWAKEKLVVLKDATGQPVPDMVIRVAWAGLLWLAQSACNAFLQWIILQDCSSKGETTIDDGPPETVTETYISVMTITFTTEIAQQTTHDPGDLKVKLKRGLNLLLRGIWH
ncbi:hypothetical protein ABW19_dt0202998 [Dactylella cylindrospora]|nr:hypothetical protein ABW19_dt0202998 [Dactylella cylindrospora]